MASAPLYFRTPHIEEIPIANARQAPGFAWVAVPNAIDPAKAQLEVSGKKRARNTTTTISEGDRDRATKRKQAHLESLIARLNSEGTKDVSIPALKKENAAGKAGKTPVTKKILASNKDFKHHVDDDEALFGEATEENAPQRASKTPLARRQQQQQEDSVMTGIEEQALPFFTQIQEEDSTLDDFNAIPAFPSADVVQALLAAPPLNYSASVRAPSYAPTVPSRKFCEACGYFGRVRCLKCGAWTCSEDCYQTHQEVRCQRFYA